MKNQTWVNTQKLINDIKSELGIDILKYKNDEAIERIGKVFMLQNYAVSKVYFPISLSLMGFFAGFFVIETSILGYIIYSIIGLLLFLSTGVLYGIVNLLGNLKSDLHFIVQYGLNTFDHAINDLHKIDHRSEDFINNDNHVGMVFEGIMMAVVTPTIANNVKTVPLAGKILSKGVGVTMYRIVNIFKKEDFQVKIDVKENGEKILGFAGNTRKKEDNFLVTSDDAINNTLSSIQKPFRLSLTLFSGLLVIFLLLMTM